MIFFAVSYFIALLLLIRSVHILAFQAKYQINQFFYQSLENLDERSEAENTNKEKGRTIDHENQCTSIVISKNGKGWNQVRKRVV